MKMGWGATFWAIFFHKLIWSPCSCVRYLWKTCEAEMFGCLCCISLERVSNLHSEHSNVWNGWSAEYWIFLHFFACIQTSENHCRTKTMSSVLPHFSGCKDYSSSKMPDFEKSCIYVCTHVIWRKLQSWIIGNNNRYIYQLFSCTRPRTMKQKRKLSPSQKFVVSSPTGFKLQGLLHCSL
jgi:hypothetical protein